MPVPVVQIRGVRVRVNERRMPVRMGVPSRHRDARLVGVNVMLVVRVRVIVLRSEVDVLVRVSLAQQESQPRRHDLGSFSFPISFFAFTTLVRFYLMI